MPSILSDTRDLLITLTIITAVFLAGILTVIVGGEGAASLWLAGLYLVYAGAVILLARMRSTPSRTFSLREDFAGDVHEVVDLEGIGPTYAQRLHAAGIFHTQELLFASDATLREATGVPPKTIANWRSMAQLVKVRGIGPQYAEALTRGGVEGIEGLRDCDPEVLARSVNAYLDGLKSTVIGQRISAKRIQTWRAAARRMTKRPIDVPNLKVRRLESKAARAGARSA